MSVSAKYPRSLIPLVLILLMVIVAFVFLRGYDKKSSLNLGGLVFPVAAEDIKVIHLSRDGSEFKFERISSTGWSVSGNVSDFVDPKAMNDLVEFLVTVSSGRVLPGTEVEDRRYGFDSNGSMRLAVFATEGREIRLALGDVNPVTGGVYGSGAGRPGCFPLGQGLRNKLMSLPQFVQEDQLLPPFNKASLSKIEVWRGSEKLTLKLLDSRWWIEEPEDGMAQLGIPFRKYNAVYGDRRQIIDGQPWLLADAVAVEKLIYESSRVQVRDIISPQETPEKMEEWAMHPTFRKIVFHGTGINGDPTAGSADVLTLSYGQPLGNDYVPFVRRDNLMLADVMAVETLALPLGQWLDIGAMPFRVELGDSLHMEKEGRWLVSAYPGKDADISRWVGSIATPARESLSNRDRQNIIENLIVDLDRLEILQIMQPTDKAQVLEDTERVSLAFWSGVIGNTGRMTVEFGWLNLEYFSEAEKVAVLKLAAEEDGQRPAGMWVPSTGKFIQIPAHVVISFRSLGQL